jgi:hypothetical protein
MMEIRQIKIVSSLEDEDPDNGNVDVHVELEDGRIFSFVVATPQNIYECMDNERINYFFGIPQVFVRKLSVENVERAFRALVSEDGGRFFQVYGIPQE